MGQFTARTFSILKIRLSPTDVALLFSFFKNLKMSKNKVPVNKVTVINQLNISFDNERASFLPGQVISGHVNVELSQPTQITNIRLFFQGNSHVSAGNFDRHAWPRLSV